MYIKKFQHHSLCILLTLFAPFLLNAQVDTIINTYTELGYEEGSYPRYNSITIQNNGVLKVLKSGMRIDSLLLIEPGGRIEGGYIRMVKGSELINNSGPNAVDSTTLSLFGTISIKGDYPTVLNGILVGWHGRSLNVYNDLTILYRIDLGTSSPADNCLINMNGHTLTLGDTISIKGYGKSSYINTGTGGKVKKYFSIDTLNYIPLGDNNLKKEVFFSVTNGTATDSSYVMLDVQPTMHPKALGAATGDYINRHYNYNIKNTNNPQIHFQYAYVEADVVGNEQSYYAGLWDGDAWLEIDAVDVAKRICTFTTAVDSGALTAGRYLGKDIFPCEAPHQLNVTDISFDAAILNWNAINGADSYHLKYRTGASLWLYKTNIDTNFWELSGLTDSTIYEWAVYTTCNTLGFEDSSLYSSPDTFMTFWNNQCYPPQLPVLKTLSHNTVKLEWNDTYHHTDSFEIWLQSTEKDSILFSKDTVLTINGLTPETPYNVKIKTYCGVDSISYNYSPELQFTTLAPCTSPTNRSYRIESISSASILWDDVTGKASYALDYKLEDGPGWTSITDINDTSYLLTSLSEYKPYQIRIKTICIATGESGFSKTVDFTTWKNCDQVPLNPSVLISGSNGARISWEAVNGVSAYEILYRQTSSTEWNTKTTDINTTNIVSLSPLTSYEWKVRSFCEGTETNSGYTDPLSFTTLAPGSLQVGVGFNVIAEYYGLSKGYPAWTDSINWEEVIDMGAYSNGANDFEKFENARDELYAKGGGVLYYPGGVYDFSDHPTDPNGRGVMLKKGIVILGEAPESDKKAIKSNEEAGLSNLPTKFIFPYVTRTDANGNDAFTPDMWNCIGLMPDKAKGEKLHDVDLTGIAWVDIDGGYIYMGPDMDWGATYATASAWLSSKVKQNPQDWTQRIPDGTFFMDPWAGSPSSGKDYHKGANGRFVFGCKLNNSALVNDVIDYGFGPAGYYGGFRFGARITVYGSNVFIANNAIPQSNKNFIYKQLTTDKKKDGTIAERNLMFDYGNGIGIDVNKQLVSQCDNRTNMQNGPFYEDNVVIIDNYVYSHGNKGYEFSGNWVIVKGNVNYRHFLGVDYATPNGDNVYGLGTNWNLSMDGYSISMENSPDFLSRAFDYGGMNGWIDNNWYTGTGTALPANDGEGILMQRHTGSENFSWAITRNSQGSTGKQAYMGPYDAHTIGLLEAWNIQRGTVGLHNPKSSYGYDISLFNNYKLDGTTPTEMIGLGGINVDSASFITDCPQDAPAAPGNMKIEAKQGYVDIAWQDNADNELGFRIDRRLHGSAEWETVVYRPMEMKSTDAVFTYSGKDAYGNLPAGFGDPVTMDFNQQTWKDFLAPKGEALEYRVIALDCEETTVGTTALSESTLLPIQVGSPFFSINTGEYGDAQLIEIFCPTPGSAIYYTTDGSEPGLGSILYTGPVLIGESTTLKAKAFKGDNYPSPVAEANYIISSLSNAVQQRLINYWPNPTDEQLFLSIESVAKGLCKIAIYDFAGKLMMKTEITKETRYFEANINTSSLSKGVYLIKIDLNGETSQMKFVKE